MSLSFLRRVGFSAWEGVGFVPDLTWCGRAVSIGEFTLAEAADEQVPVIFELLREHPWETARLNAQNAAWERE